MHLCSGDLLGPAPCCAVCLSSPETVLYSPETVLSSFLTLPLSAPGPMPSHLSSEPIKCLEAVLHPRFSKRLAESPRRCLGYSLESLTSDQVPP